MYSWSSTRSCKGRGFFVGNTRKFSYMGFPLTIEIDIVVSNQNGQELTSSFTLVCHTNENIGRIK